MPDTEQNESKQCVVCEGQVTGPQVLWTEGYDEDFCSTDCLDVFYDE